MISTIAKYLIVFFFLTLAQVVVLNNIAIGGVASPLLYVYFLLLLPSTLPRNVVITVGFLLGLTIDVFCDTYGMHALATVVMAFLREPIVGLFNRRNIQLEEYSAASMGRTAFLSLVVTFVFLHHLLLFAVEYFSFYHALVLLYKTVASVGVTVLLIMLLENVRSTAHDK